jgi:hypothetical protein
MFIRLRMPPHRIATRDTHLARDERANIEALAFGARHSPCAIRHCVRARVCVCVWKAGLWPQIFKARFPGYAAASSFSKWLSPTRSSCVRGGGGGHTGLSDQYKEELRRHTCAQGSLFGLVRSCER